MYVNYPNVSTPKYRLVLIIIEFENLSIDNAILKISQKYLYLHYHCIYVLIQNNIVMLHGS